MTGIAHQAASLWGLDPARITLAAQRENAVWRAEGPDGSHALRLHRPGYRSGDELRSELEWMAMLADGGLDVPRPVPSRNGRLVEDVGGTMVDLLTWLPGRMVGRQGALEGIGDRTGHMRHLGALLARLHDLSDDWSPPPDFTRPRWDHPGLVGDTPLWGPFWDNPDLSATDRAALALARGRAGAALQAQAPGLDFGLIHADAITENVMVDGGRLSLIDFDDGGWGYRDFDLATVLLRQLSAPDYPALRAALIAGYAPRRAVDAGTLDLMLMLRALTYLGWIIPRMDEPGGRARSLRAVATAMPLVHAYLRGPNA